MRICAAILLTTVSTGGVAAGRDWRPTGAQIAAVEAKVVMPVGASGPLRSYERYYAGDVQHGRRVIRGELLRLTKVPVVPPVLRIVRVAELPPIADFGCGVIRFTYDIDRKIVSAAECGFDPGPPPRP
jgi:hypothetical protein